MPMISVSVLYKRASTEVSRTSTEKIRPGVGREAAKAARTVSGSPGRRWRRSAGAEVVPRVLVVEERDDLGQPHRPGVGVVDLGHRDHGGGVGRRRLLD